MSLPGDTDPATFVTSFLSTPLTVYQDVLVARLVEEGVQDSTKAYEYVFPLFFLYVFFFVSAYVFMFTSGLPSPHSLVCML